MTANPYEECKSTDTPCRKHPAECELFRAWERGYAAARADMEAILRAQAEAVIESLRKEPK